MGTTKEGGEDMSRSTRSIRSLPVVVSTVTEVHGYLCLSDKEHGRKGRLLRLRLAFSGIFFHLCHFHLSQPGFVDLFGVSTDLSLCIIPRIWETIFQSYFIMIFRWIIFCRFASAFVPKLCCKQIPIETNDQTAMQK